MYVGKNVISMEKTKNKNKKTTIKRVISVFFSYVYTKTM